MNTHKATEKITKELKITIEKGGYQPQRWSESAISHFLKKIKLMI